MTMPLQIELYYQEFRALAQVSAFSLAAVLAGLALVTLAVKTWLEWRYADSWLQRALLIEDRSMEIEDSQRPEGVRPVSGTP